MSGIVGIASAEPDWLTPQLLSKLTDTLRFRGPDDCRTWLAPGIGFGHTLLSTSDVGALDRQPCTLDGDVWIAADARIDGRADLIQALSNAGREVSDGAADAQLILHAYAAWGERCVDRLLGDFAFGIWDGPGRRLFCARDHFGVRPFFYAEPRASLVFSNTLECVRRHPGVREDLDDLSIADFLLFAYSQRQNATAFAEIRRLPPGHALTWAPGSPAVIQQYWQLPVHSEVRYRDSRDYVERFMELFHTAVRDRLSTRSIAVSMSGGLDSSAIAAAAASILAGAGAPFDLRAHTMVLDHAVPDEERHFAGLVAARLGVPIDFFTADDYPPFAAASAVAYELAEPGDSTYRTRELDFAARIAAGSRVVLSGMDADSFLAERTLDYFAGLAQRRQFGDLASAMTRYAATFRRRPPLGVRRAARWLAGRQPPVPPLPGWLNPDLVRSLDLQERARIEARRPAAGLFLRPRAERAARSTLWTSVFDRGDAACTRQPLEYRYPFADVRLVGYLLAIPVVPWCCDKTLLREALKGVLPEAVRLRRKTPVEVDPLLPALRSAESKWLDQFRPATSLGRYVNRRAVPPVTGETGEDVYVNLRPLCLSRWLDRHERRHDVTRSEDAGELAVTPGR